ncbi:ATP-binding protein [Micromonospora sp. NPDC005161]
MPGRDHPPGDHVHAPAAAPCPLRRTSHPGRLRLRRQPKLPAAQIRDLAVLRWLHSGESIVLHGPVGVGKTHVAQALGHLAIRQGAEVDVEAQQPLTLGTLPYRQPSRYHLVLSGRADRVGRLGRRLPCCQPCSLTP